MTGFENLNASVQTYRQRTPRTRPAPLNVETIDEKERLAAGQQRLVTRVCPGSNHNASLVRFDMLHVITARLQGNRARRSGRSIGGVGRCLQAETCCDRTT